jgi:hypothetical protein
MKVIINKEQLDKMKSKLNGFIDNMGFFKTSKILGISDIKLLGMIDYDISKMELSDLYAILVKGMNNYEGSKIVFNMDDNLEYWVYKEQIGVYKINCVVFASPEFNKGKVYVENSHCWFDNKLDFYNTIDYDVETINYDIPTHFNSWDDMVNWYENGYLPKTYMIMQRQAKEIIKQIKQKNEI